MCVGKESHYYETVVLEGSQKVVPELCVESAPENTLQESAQLSPSTMWILRIEHGSSAASPLPAEPSCQPLFSKFFIAVECA